MVDLGSPDGEWVAYTVTTTLEEEDRSRTRIWMAPAAGGEALPLTAESESSSSPKWSPDGRYLGFLSSRNDGERRRSGSWTGAAARRRS